MTRALHLILAFMMSVVVAREASAITITETNFDTFVLGALITPVTPPSDFITGAANDIGDLHNEVYLNGADYTYVHRVIPGAGQDNNERFATEFAPAGFTGIAGWSFSQALGLGGMGDATDFAITETSSDFVRWTHSDTFIDLWDAGPLAEITFFYVSSKPPGLPNAFYNLSGAQVGTGTSYAPTPEPGSMMLLGSGLAALYGAARRRRNQKSTSATQVG